MQHWTIVDYYPRVMFILSPTEDDPTRTRMYEVSEKFYWQLVEIGYLPPRFPGFPESSREL